MLFIRLYLILSVVLLSACASDQAIIRHQANVDFSEIKSYSIFKRASKFTEQQNINDTLRNSIELAIEKEFDKQGFVYREPEQADVMVAYVLTGIEVLKPFNTTGKFTACPACPSNGRDKEGRQKRSRANANGNQQGSKDRQLAKADAERNIGTLVIDILDAKTFRTLWESEYPLNVKSSDNSREVQEKIKQAITEIMKMYPTNQPAK